MDQNCPNDKKIKFNSTQQLQNIPTKGRQGIIVDTPIFTKLDKLVSNLIPVCYAVNILQTCMSLGLGTSPGKYNKNTSLCDVNPQIKRSRFGRTRCRY